MDVDAGAMEVDTTQLSVSEHIPSSHMSNGYRPDRRGSMSQEEERQRRASIKAILADESIPIQERRRSIQNLMDGRRSSIGTASTVSVHDENPYGYGDGDGSGMGDVGRRFQPSMTDNSPMHFDAPGEICIPISNEATKRAELTRPHCVHYDRKCTLIAPCCGAAFGCRICHDDSPILPPLLIHRQAMGRYPRSSSMPMNPALAMQTPEDTHHTIDRFAVKEIICRECYTKQSSKE